MKHAFFGVLGITATLLLAGCNATRTLSPPVTNNDTPTLQSQLTGEWTGTYGQEQVRLKVAFDSEKQCLRITGDMTENKTFRPMFPMLGGVSTINGKLFLTVLTDTEQLLPGHHPSSAMLLITPFYLLQLERRESQWILELVTFAEYRDSQWRPLSADLQLARDGLVLNDTDTLNRLLREGRYRLEPFMTLSPAQTPPAAPSGKR